MPTPERPKDKDPKGLDRKPVQVSETLKKTLVEAFRQEFGHGGRAALVSRFAKHDPPHSFDIGADFDF
jgi:hypothetical protein